MGDRNQRETMDPMDYFRLSQSRSPRLAPTSAQPGNPLATSMRGDGLSLAGNPAYVIRMGGI
jgi:hypothetical protein